MRNVKIVKLSPEKDNIMYTVKKVAKDVEEVFADILAEPKEKKTDTPKTVVYCRSIKDCGELFSIFDEHLKEDGGKLFAMYHSKTPQNIQHFVLTQIMEEDSEIRIVFATSALGMGVNIPDIRRVIHHGVPGDMEQSVQEIGRGGHNGSQATAVLMYASYHLSHCGTTMRNYVKGEEGKCRRELICSYFMEKAEQMPPKHNCCDLCDNECDCEECEEPQKEDFAEKPRNLCQRTVDDSEKTLI